jgi:asparagine synthase (glutamine-hydrolysing)
MCGFAGFTGPVGDRDACLDLAGRMLAALTHRGPDGTRVRRHRQVTFAHCALPFVDPARAAQPFVSASGQTALVFNGEIYNHAELRRELTAGGARLSTGCDTEVLAALYERDGMRLLDRVRGMFAFVLHDARRGRLVLARDPFGKKPLYYADTPAGLLFASELSALLAHPGCPRQLDVAALADYLVLQAYPAPASAIAGVAKVRPGTYLEVDLGGAARKETTYWTPRLPATRRRLPLAEAERELERVLRTAVERRVTSTGDRLGVLLSGGLDSSVVAALAQRMAGQPVPTFSAGFTDPAFDESSAAATVARHLGTEHHPVRIGPGDLAEVFTGTYGRLDEPLADPSLLPTILVCRQARRHVRGVLTGDGADEVLLGYRYFQAERAIGVLLRVVPPAALDRLPRLLDPLPVRHGNLPLGSVLRQLARGLREAPERRFYAATAPFGPGQLAGLFRPEAARALADHRPYAELEALGPVLAALPPLERSQLGIVCHFLRDVILTKLDRGAMLNSVEPRSPFLDLDLVEFCATLPAHRKLRGLTGKYLLRRLAARWLPADIAGRRKLGFRAPVGSLLCGQLRPVVQDLLAPSRLDAHGLFDPAAVRRLVDDHLALRQDHARKLWALLCFQIWYDEALRPGGAAPATTTAALESGHAC